MFKKFSKVKIALAIAGIAILCGVLVKTFTADDFIVKFTSTYAEVGKELSVEVEGAKNVRYEWKVGGEVIENETASYTPTEADLEKWIEVSAKSFGRTSTTNMYFSWLFVLLGFVLFWRADC